MPRLTRLKVGPSEAEFTRQVLQLAKLHGWRSFHARPGLTRSGRWVTAVQGDGVGFPDLLLIHPHRGLIVVAELKVGGRVPTLEQRGWLSGFAAAGVPAHVWTPDSWPEIERVLGGG